MIDLFSLALCKRGSSKLSHGWFFMLIHYLRLAEKALVLQCCEAAGAGDILFWGAEWERDVRKCKDKKSQTNNRRFIYFYMLQLSKRLKS